jgi:hypothetical protein
MFRSFFYHRTNSLLHGFRTTNHCRLRLSAFNPDFPNPIFSCLLTSCTSLLTSHFISTPRPSQAIIPHPELSIPPPTLTHDFRMSVTLKDRVAIGKSPFGDRKWISFTGGSWAASWGSGIVLVSPLSSYYPSFSLPI